MTGVSFEERVDDRIYQSGIEVIRYPLFRKTPACAVSCGGEKIIGLNTRLDKETRVYAKIHEYVHLDHDLYYKDYTKAKSRSWCEAKVRRRAVYEFLPVETLNKAIASEYTFDPHILAEVLDLPALLVSDAEHVYYELDGETPPEIEDAYL